MCNFMLNTQTKLIKLENVCWAWKELQKSLNIGPLIRKQDLEKNPKLINVGPTSFPEFEVINKNIIIQIGKIHWTLETCWKSQKIIFLTPA